MVLVKLVFEVGVCREFGHGDRINVVAAVYGASVDDSAFPLPDIRGCGEAVVANEVGAAVQLVVKFAGTFVEEELEVELSVAYLAGVVAVGACADFVEEA